MADDVQQNKDSFFEKYHEIEYLGEGGFGYVCKARTKIECILVAVKCIPMKEEKIRKSTEIEVSMLRSFEHKNIVRYIDVMYENSPKVWQEQQEKKYHLRPQDNSNTLDSTDQSSADANKDMLDDVVEFVYDENAEIKEDALSNSCDNSSRVSEVSLNARDTTVGECTESKVERKPMAYIIMELCKTETLKDRLVPEYLKDRGLERTEALRIFSQVVEGIIYLHDRKLIHRDLKPDNIFFSTDASDTVKIGDFGLVRREIVKESDDGKSTTDTYATGTQSYMAPEQKLIKNRKLITRKVDIYAMGIILFELLYQCSTGFERIKVFADLHLDPPKLPIDVETKIGHAAKELILKSIQRISDSRPTAIQMKNQLCGLKLNDDKCSSLKRDIKNTPTIDNKMTTYVTTYVTTTIWKQVDDDLKEMISSHLNREDDWKSERILDLHVVVLKVHRHEVVAFYNKRTMERFIIGIFSPKDHENKRSRMLLKIHDDLDIFRKQNVNLTNMDNVSILKEMRSNRQIVLK